ncbi:hypothetical protein ACMC9M_08480 [Pseudomonadota bacterium 24LQ007]
MIKKSIITFFLWLGVTQYASALDVEGYFKMTEKADNGNRTAEILLEFYHRGIYETIQSIMVMNDLKLNLGDLIPACIPSFRAISTSSISEAIKAEIGTYDAPINQELYDSQPVGAIAVIGLHQVFPCNSNN